MRDVFDRSKREVLRGFSLRRAFRPSAIALYVCAQVASYILLAQPSTTTRENGQAPDEAQSQLDIDPSMLRQLGEESPSSSLSNTCKAVPFGKASQALKQLLPLACLDRCIALNHTTKY